MVVGLKERVSSFSNEKLLEIVNSKPGEYTDEALLLASNEIKRRKENSVECNNNSASEIDYPASKNIISIVLKFLGYLEIILGILWGIYIYAQTETFFGFAIALSGFIFGMLFVAFGEVINLLHQIKNK